jgi:DNA-binding NarL/FixJ family response regulator
MAGVEESAASSLFLSLVKDAGHSKSVRAAEHVRDACDYLSEHRIEIGIAEVARLCSSTGPKAQSIHNNKALKSYVFTRRAEQSLRPRPNDSIAGYVSKDIQANAVIHALQAQVKRERELKEGLKRAIQNSGEYDFEAVVRTGRLVSFARSSPSLDSEVIEIIHLLLNTEHLRRFGLTINTDRILAPDRNNRVFLEKRQLLKLRSLVEPSNR